MPSTPPPLSHRSLAASLNPYSSMARSTYPKEPESPSAMLLRELQGDGDATDSPQGGRPRESSRLRQQPAELGRSEAFPFPRTGAVASPFTPQGEEAEDEDDDGPSQSLWQGGAAAGSGGGDRTPRSPPTPLPLHRPMAIPHYTPPRASSPGPFQQPPSSSASGRSSSTSPGPSIISVYASVIDGVDAESSSAAQTAPASRDQSTSPESSPQRPRRSVPMTATFREPPIARPAAPLRAPSGSSKLASPRPAVRGYLDPPEEHEPRKGKRKGKEKARNQGGRRYVAVAEEDEVDELSGGQEEGREPRKVGLNAYEKALWRWVNVEDLDGYLQEVYAYYKGKGFLCIILARFLNLVTTFFVIGFSTFLFSCIDYPKLGSELSSPNAIGRLDDVLVEQCLTGGSFTHKLFIGSVALVYLFQLSSFLMSIPRLLDMYRFYTHLLGIPDADIQTLPWPEIVRLIGDVRKHNPVTSLSNGHAGALAEMIGDDAEQGPVKKLDAHDIANRILRQENYLIALFNKDLLDLRVRFPVPHALIQYIPSTLLAPSSPQALPSSSGDKRERRFVSFGKNTLTKALEWNLRFCLMGYLFDGRGQVRKEFVREKRRKDLVEGLKRRFVFMAALNAIFAPFIVIYLLVYSFFRYFDEYHKNPSSIGSRQYTPYAQWKFREFNELPHLFERRLDRSYPTAKEYIDQFPKERTALIMRFVAFVAGSFAAVLLAASLIDPDLFLHFEITPHRTVLFYLGLFGGVLAVARGMIPDENLVFDPEASLREVVKWTHFLPGEWQGKMHSQAVHQEFGTLFSMKIGIFFQELLSVLLTPLILCFSLPRCAGAIIDFFREFTVHVEGVGYVCSFAVFDFRRHGNTEPTVATSVADPTTTYTNVIAGSAARHPRNVAERDRREWARANENKMEKSFLHFKATHPDWVPDPSSSVFLDKLVGAHQRQQGGGLGGSVYGGGGRGLGLGSVPVAGQSSTWATDERTLAERSRSYDRAWAKSSHMLHSQPQRQGARRGRGASAERDGGKGLETMAEREDEDDGAGAGPSGGKGWREPVPDGWDDGNLRHHGAGDEPGEGEDEHSRRFLGDLGLVGILQHLVAR